MKLAIKLGVFPIYELPILSLLLIGGLLILFIRRKTPQWQRRIAFITLFATALYTMMMTATMLGSFGHRYLHLVNEGVEPDPWQFYEMIAAITYRIAIYCLISLPAILLPALVLLRRRD